MEAAVVICAFDAERLPRTANAVASVLGQDPAPVEVIVVVDHNPALLVALREKLPAAVRVIASAGAPGLGAAWNTGAAAAQAPVIAFLDDDAEAEPGWLRALVRPFADPAVAATGGVAEPVWSGPRPRWLGDEWLWVVGCTYAGLRRDGPVRNVLGCNMAIRAEALSALGGFLPGIGRLGRRPLGGGETELCIRARRRGGCRAVLAVPDAVVRHHVPPARQTRRYFVRRCFYEGVSKAVIHSLAGQPALEVERAYVRTTLRSAARQDSGKLAAATAGLAAACIGYGLGSLARPPRE